MRLGRLNWIEKFQKDLIVWKPDSDFLMFCDKMSEFQKDLIVWKLIRTGMA